MKEKYLRVVLLACALLGHPVLGGTQAFPSQTTSPMSAGPTGADNRGQMQPPASVLEKQAIGRNSERQKRLVADTEKLLALATELKSEVDKTDKNILSVDVVKKAEEIEKLAKSVKERMKG